MISKGHCLCKATRFEFTGATAWCGHCHCESCRRNCSAPFTTFIGVPRLAFRWTGQATGEFHSSPGVTRHFCTTCGSPMAYDRDSDTANIHLYPVCLDDQTAIIPTFHELWDERVPWLTVQDDLEKRIG